MTLKEFIRQGKEEIKEEIMKLDSENHWRFEFDFSNLKGQYALLDRIEQLAEEGYFSED